MEPCLSYAHTHTHTRGAYKTYLYSTINTALGSQPLHTIILNTNNLRPFPENIQLYRARESSIYKTLVHTILHIKNISYPVIRHFAVIRKNYNDLRLARIIITTNDLSRNTNNTTL